MRKRSHLSILTHMVALAGLAVLTACSNGDSSRANASGNTPEQRPVLSEPYVGRAVLGPLGGADVSVYSLSAIDGDPIYKTTTTSGSTLDDIGLFSIPATLLFDNELYIVKVSGGEDFDRNDDGRIDDSPSSNTATVHAVLTPAEIRHGGYYVTTQTEFMYRAVAYRLAADFPVSDIVDELDYRAKDAVGVDIDGDGDIDRDDVVTWHPGDSHEVPISRTLLADLRGEITDTASHNAIWEAVQDHIQDMGKYFSPADAGYVRNLAVRDGLAYVAGTTTLNTKAIWVMDVSDATGKSKPILSSLPLQADLLVTNGQYVYAVETGVGLHVLDVSTPEAPVEVGIVAFVENPRDMIYADGAIYIAAQTALYTIDVGDPAHPTITLNQNALGKKYSSLAKCNDYLAVYEDGSYLNVFDLTDPLHPSQLLSGWMIGDPPQAMTCVGQQLYSVGQKGLSIVNMNDPANPQLVGFEPLSGNPDDIEVYNDVAYITTSNGSISFEIRAVDVHDPAAPVTIATLPLSLKGLSIAVDQGRIYVVTGASGIITFDHVNLLDYIQHGQNMFLSSMRLGGKVTRVASAANITYLTSAQTLYAIDVKDARLPKMGGQLDIPATSLNAKEAPRAILLRGDFIYAGKPYSPLWTFNIINPAAMYLSSQVTDQRAGGVYDLTTYGDYLYYVNWWTIQSADIASPSAPQLGGDNLFATDNVTTIASSTSRPVAYVGGVQGIDYIFDLSKPGQPEQLAMINDSTIGITDAVITGNYVYVVSGYANSGLLRIIDISSPAQPVVVAKEEIFNYPYAIEVRDGYAYIATIQSGVRIIDVHDITKPYLLGVIDTPADAFDIAVGNKNLYIADGVDGLHISRAASRQLP